MHIGPPGELFLGVHFDASWATRRDNASKGGNIQFVISRDAVASGQPVRLVVLYWTTERHPRLSRASVDAEAQSGVITVDRL